MALRDLRGGMAAALASLLVVLVLLLAAPGAAASGGQNPGANAPNPLIGQEWWDQNTEWNDAWNGYRSLARRGRHADAAKVLLLAQAPRWIAAGRRPGATPRTPPPATLRPRTRRTRRWTPTCGSSGPASPMGPATGGRRGSGAWREKRAIQIVERAK